MSALFAAISLLAMGIDEITPGDSTRTLTVGGRIRTYLIHVPPEYDAARSWPLVLAFHGGATDAAVMVRFSGLSEKADAAGFIVVYPNGTGELTRLLTWNAGACCGYARANQVDDVAFTRAVLDDVGQIANIDKRHIFATGISNGGMMAYRLAAEMPERIAAIAPVAGTLCIHLPPPSRPVPVIHFHGTDDRFVPFAGGQGDRSISRTIFTPVEQTIRTWVAIDGCRTTPIVSHLPNKAADGLPVSCYTYGHGRDGAEVILYKIDGGGHTWPGRTTRIAALGKSTKNISANDLMWDFFVKHPLK